MAEVQPVAHHAEYPKMLRHPEHRDAIPASQEAVVQNGGVKWITIPAVPERMPDVVVATQEEEAFWRRKGYGPAGHWDEDAFERAKSAPIPEDYDPQEWPKWMDSGRVDADGKPVMIIVQDPNAIPPEVLDRKAREYPKWINGRVVQNADEEAALGDSAEPVLEASRSSASIAQHQPYVGPGAPQGILDAAALKREIVDELAPVLKDLICDALMPATPAPSIKRRAAPLTPDMSSEGEDRISMPPNEIAKPKKLSGAAYRKLRRQRAEEEMMRSKSSPKLAALSWWQK